MNIRQTLFNAFCLFFIATGYAHAALVANVDSYGIPASRVLLVEPFGVLDNDTLDGQNAGENGVTAILHTNVTKGTLSCPGVGPGLCADGSFEYTPGPGFDGTDSFVYQAVTSTETSPPTTVTLNACTGGPTVFTCWLETSYLNKLSELGYNNVFVESFEGTVWDVARSPAPAASIESKGIIWTSNHPTTNNITTGTGPARTGMWGGYDPDHGVAAGTPTECDIDNPPITCRPHDGLSGSILPGGDTLHAVGGYITGITGANIAILLDAIPHNIGKVTPSHHFFSVIDTAGFNGFEFRELDGKVGQALFIWGDDFIIATSGAIPANNTPLLAPIGDQTTDVNIQLSITLNASDLDDGDIMSFSMSGGPVGATFLDNKDGTANFIWRPDYNQAGSYTVTFTVTDNAIPAATASETITFTVNDVNRPPLLSAIGDKFVDENTELSFLLTASDPDGNSLSFVKSGGTTAATLIDHGDGTATFSWTPSIGQAGDYPVTFTVTDDGVPVASDLETITITVIDPFVDITLPQIQILSPVNGAALSGTPVTVSGSASDETALASVTVNGVTATLGGGNFSASVPLVAGANSLTAIATDSSGNSASTSIQVTYTPPDVTLPQIQILSPVNGAALSGTPVTVSGSASDDTALASVTVNGVAATLGGGNFSASVALVAGTNTLTAVATDSSGNTANVQIQVTYTPTVGSLQFSSASYSMAENGAMATITVTRVNGSSGAVGVDYASTDGSATDGSDYTAVSGSLGFADGELTKTFTIPIFDDVDYEGDESVNLSLSFPTGGASLGSPSTAVLIITEDDPVPSAGSLQFSTSNYTETENSTTATITVTRINGSFGTVGVDYASSDGTASAGSDYTAVIGSLSFADGVTSQTFTIDIFDDFDYEGDETVFLTLSKPTGGAGLDSPSTAVLAITEDDPVPPAGSLQLSAVNYSVAEDGVSATITVSRTGGSFGTVGVDYASNDGTATAGSDYAAVIGNLSFDDGVTSQTFTIDIFDDADYEGNETVNLILSNPVGGAGLGSPTITVLSITEDDPVPPSGSLQFSDTDYQVNEKRTSINITVTRVGGSYGSVDVDYAATDGSATAGSDYTAVSGRLSFADGVTSQKFSIEILGDAIDEANESLNLILSNPTGGAGLASPSTASLLIVDDDPQTDDGSTGGSSSGSIDVITLMLMFSFYLRSFRKNVYS